MNVDTDRLIARIMRLSSGDLQAQWTTAGIVRVIEEEAAFANCQFRVIDNPEKTNIMVS